MIEYARERARPARSRTRTREVRYKTTREVVSAVFDAINSRDILATTRWGAERFKAIEGGLQFDVAAGVFKGRVEITYIGDDLFRVLIHELKIVRREFVTGLELSDEYMVAEHIAQYISKFLEV